MADDRLVRTVRDGIPEGKRNEVDRRKDGETHWNKQATGLQEEEEGEEEEEEEEEEEVI